MSLKSILKEMSENRPNAEMELNMTSPATYNSRLGLKRAASETLKRLRSNYRDELLKSSAFIVVTGASEKAFSQVSANEKFGCFSVDPEEFYLSIAKDVSPPSVVPSLYGRESIGKLFGIAQNVLRDKCNDLDIESYPALAFSDKYNTGISTQEEFAQVLKGAISDQVGSEILGIYAVNTILDSAIARNNTSSVTPIILGTSDEKLALDLQKNLKRLNSKTFLVVAGKSSKSAQTTPGAISVKHVSEDSVGEALTTIKNKILS